MSEKKGRSRRRRRKTDQTEDGFFWSDTKERIQRGEITPFVGETISTNLIFTDFVQVISDWADEVEHPEPSSVDLNQVAQFVRMKQDPSGARASYLNSLKISLLDKAEKDQVSERRIKGADDNFDQLTFTKMAEDLGYLDFEEQEDHPLNCLASLPLPIYITTSYHQFLETALIRLGKKPHSEIYPWRPNLENKVPSIFAQDPNFTPSIEEPLVYHLYGRDDYYDSLVLSENDYLDFLIKVAQDMKRDRVSGSQQGLPSIVEETLAQSSLLLLGYDLNRWDFRILFRGLISFKNKVRQKQGISIQLNQFEAEAEGVLKDYLENYFLESSKLKIYWGTPQSCLSKLQQIWER